MQEFFNIIANFGFPVAVASYLLFRFEKKLETLAEANEKLCDEIVRLKEKITALGRVIKKLKKL